MSKFDVKVRRITAISSIPKADRMQLAHIEGYVTCIKKGQFKEGDLVVYLPEAAILPEFVLRVLGLWNEAENKGLCAGENGNRIKVLKLRGILSQGIAYPLAFDEDGLYGEGWYLQDADTGIWKVEEGADVAGLLQVTKHVPEVPKELLGAVMPVGRHLLPAFDIEDIKKYPHFFEEGEEIVITEKLHGIMTGTILLPESEAINGERFFVFGKGLGADGLAFIDDEANKNNVYLRTTKAAGIREKLQTLADKLGETENPVFCLGETFGQGVQDLGYGVSPTFRAFAFGTGFRGREVYIDRDDALAYAAELDIQWVPELYRGPFSKELVARIISGMTTIEGHGTNIREGGVIEPVKNRYNEEIGRVVLKAISPEYLGREDGTEYQ